MIFPSLDQNLKAWSHRRQVKICPGLLLGTVRAGLHSLLKSRLIIIRVPRGRGLCVRVHICMYMCMDVCMYNCVCACMCSCAHVYMYVYAYLCGDEGVCAHVFRWNLKTALGCNSMYQIFLSWLTVCFNSSQVLGQELLVPALLTMGEC